MSVRRRAAPRASSIAGRCPLIPPISRSGCRLVVVPINTFWARLELIRGGQTLAVLGERRGVVWHLVDGLHDRSLRRVLPLLEARTRLADLPVLSSSLAGVHRLPTLRLLRGRT